MHLGSEAKKLYDCEEKTARQKGDLSEELILPLGFQMEARHIMKRIIIFNS